MGERREGKGREGNETVMKGNNGSGMEGKKMGSEGSQ